MRPATQGPSHHSRRVILGTRFHDTRGERRAKVRKHGIVVWLDLDNHYSGFVDG